MSTTCEYNWIVGTEYRLKFTHDNAPLGVVHDVVEVDQFLRGLLYFSDFEEASGNYSFFKEGNPGPMPDVEVQIYPDWLYLRDNGMSPSHFGYFMKRVISHFGSLQIELLD
ncbi:hypothetical protein EON80_27730 [bacterium]|nr:MAG: hypothetical protein EON80_27730 [bacterium]